MTTPKIAHPAGVPWPARLDREAALAAFVLALAAICGALASQHLWGLTPCELCLEQRLPYYWGLPVLAAVLVLWKRLPSGAMLVGLAVVAGLFAWGAYLGVYHAGVEWGLWPGPTACAGTGGAIRFDDLRDIDAARVVPCDVVQFRFLGVSLAGYNALVSVAVVKLLAMAMAGSWVRRRA